MILSHDEPDAALENARRVANAAQFSKKKNRVANSLDFAKFRLRIGCHLGLEKAVDLWLYKYISTKRLSACTPTTWRGSTLLSKF